jgi:hypothetical protein
MVLRSLVTRGHGVVKERRARRSHRGKVLAQAKEPGRKLHAGAPVGVTVGR